MLYDKIRLLIVEGLLPEGWPDLEREVALSQWKSQKNRDAKDLQKV